jgi:hypothetical protein
MYSNKDFEVQDANSHLVAAFLDVKPGMRSGLVQVQVGKHAYGSFDGKQRTTLLWIYTKVN